MRVDDPHLSKPSCEGSQVVPIRPTGSLGVLDLLGHGGVRSRSEPVRIGWGRYIRDGDAQGAAFKCVQRELYPAVAAALAMVEGGEDGLGVSGIESIRASYTRLIRSRDQSDDASRSTGDSPVIGRPLPESPAVAVDHARTVFERRKIRTPDQRAVSEDPECPRFVAGCSRRTPRGRRRSLPSGESIKGFGESAANESTKRQASIHFEDLSSDCA